MASGCCRRPIATLRSRVGNSSGFFLIGRRRKFSCMPSTRHADFCRRSCRCFSSTLRPGRVPYGFRCDDCGGRLASVIVSCFAVSTPSIRTDMPSLTLARYADPSNDDYRRTKRFLRSDAGKRRNRQPATGAWPSDRGGPNRTDDNDVLQKIRNQAKLALRAILRFRVPGANGPVPTVHNVRGKGRGKIFRD
jgi:hypothetical protein